MSLPDLSRLELECLRRLWALKEASVKEIHASLEDAPSYSTVRKIVERLENKGAVTRVRQEGKAWVYTSAVSAGAMIRREVGRLLDTLFDGSAEPLMSHLVDMDAVSAADLKAAEERLKSKPEGERA